jgi:L-malate glycosyltransferase
MITPRPKRNFCESEIRLGLAFVVNSLNPGGTERLVVEMSLAFSNSYDVQVFCLDEPGLWANQLRSKGIPVYSLWRQPGLDLTVPIKLAGHFRRKQIGIVHAHQCTPWFYAALSRMFYPIPRLLVQEHGRFYPEVEKKKRIFTNKILIKRLTHRFVSVSEDVRRRLGKFEGLDYDEIEVVYNGVKIDRMLAVDVRNSLRASAGFSSSDFVVGTVGRFDPVKNLPMLMKSVACVSKTTPSLKGLLVGDGSVFHKIKELRESLNLSDVVVMTGHRDDARRLAECMDLFVLPSFSEGTSVALLEAIAAGIPVIVSDVGGNPEIVRKEETGWVIPSDSVESLTTAILDAVKNPAKREKFTEAGRRRYLEHFTFEKMIESYRRIYGEMLNPKS